MPPLLRLRLDALRPSPPARLADGCRWGDASQSPLAWLGVPFPRTALFAERYRAEGKHRALECANDALAGRSVDETVLR